MPGHKEKPRRWGDRRGNGAVPKGRVPPLEDAYSARQATRIGHMSGRLELEALHDEPGDRKDRKEGLALQAWGSAAGHLLL